MTDPATPQASAPTSQNPGRDYARVQARSLPGPFYRFWRFLARVILKVFYRVEVFGAENVPASGALLVAANHQSYIDPPLVGGMINREMNFVAKSGLFAIGPFAWLIRNLNSVPLREDTSDVAAIKEVVRRLEQGGAVVIFPEGSRSPDGAMHEFKRGVALLVKRAKCPVVPAAVEGCFDAWPRGGLPRLFGKRVAVKYAAPIAYDELMKDGPDAALVRLATQIEAMRHELRAHLRARTRGAFPAGGAGDQTWSIEKQNAAEAAGQNG